MSSVAIGASSIVGIAQETTTGTYVAPTKFFPVTNVDLSYRQERYSRRVIRATADQIGQKKSNSHVEGSIQMEALHDVVPYFLYAGRFDVTKTGVGPYNYDAKPNDNACVTAGQALSITTVKNGIVMAYTGCVVSQMEFTLNDEGVMMSNYTIFGLDEAVQSVPTATWPTSDVFGAAEHTIQVDDTNATDFDTWAMTVDNAAEAIWRVDSGTAPSYIKWGERTVSLAVARDFVNRTDYDAFKALTSQKLEITSTDATNSIYLEMPAAIKQAYEVPVSGQGDLILANITYEGVYDTTAAASVNIIVDTSENIV